MQQNVVFFALHLSISAAHIIPIVSDH